MKNTHKTGDKMSSSHKLFSVIILILLFPAVLALTFSGTGGITPQFLYIKTLLSAGFIVTCAVSAHRSGEFGRLSLFCLIGLVFGMLGDIFIDLKIQLEGMSTLSGLLFFLVQHIVWCTGMILSAKSSPHKKRLFITLPASAVGLWIFIIVLVKVVGAELGNMTAPVFIYGTILTWAIAIPFTLREKKDLRLTALGIAAILFFISDAILVKGLFAGSYSVVGSAFNLLTYYYAQYIIALSTGLRDRKD
ncbi:MAG: hypothetical protein J6N15_03310 [Ruminiclostridium sp.]|nr:hypothetical protein [Ruminiclostridium sp.]